MLEIVRISKSVVSNKFLAFFELPFLVLLLPALVTVILFAYLPMFGMLIAFKDYKAKLGIFGSPWADLNGFSNFVQIFNTPGLPEAIVNTLVWNILGLLLSFPLPIVLALLFDEVHAVCFATFFETGRTNKFDYIKCNCKRSSNRQRGCIIFR